MKNTIIIFTLLVLLLICLSALIYFKFYNCAGENKIIFWNDNFKTCCWGLNKNAACSAGEECTKAMKYRCEK